MGCNRYSQQYKAVYLLKQDLQQEIKKKAFDGFCKEIYQVLKQTDAVGCLSYSKKIVQGSFFVNPQSY